MISAILLIGAGYLLGNQQARVKSEEIFKKTINTGLNMLNKNKHETTDKESIVANGNENVSADPQRRTYY